MSQSEKLSELQLWIRTEIATQILEMKTQINASLVSDLKSIQQQIIDSVTADSDKKIKKHVAKNANYFSGKIDDQIATEVAKSVESNVLMQQSKNNQLAIVRKQETTELVLAVCQKAQTAVYNNVMREINEKVVPKVNNMVQWVNYNMQDGAGVVDDYRRQVEHQSVKFDPNMKLVTDGKRDDRIISPHIRTFFSNED